MGTKKRNHLLINFIKSFFGDSKVIPIYRIFSVDENKEDGKSQLLTIVRNKKQAEEFIICNSMIEHSNHYLSWCNLHHLKEKEMDSIYTQKEYLNTVWGDIGQKYKIIKYYTTINSLMGTIRLLSGCYPLGCSYESIEEKAYIEILKNNFINKVEGNSKKDL